MMRRTEAVLSSCRRLLASRAAGGGGDDHGRISEADLVELFATQALTDGIFELFQLGQRGGGGKFRTLEVQELLEAVQNNVGT